MTLDPFILSRIQFAFVISMHIIFPSFTIGLASWLVVLKGLWLKTQQPIYAEIYRHWSKIFAVSFGMGVVSGLVLPYQFGTNWAGFIKTVGNVIGPLLSFEVLIAFFLEASFLGIMLFGQKRVGEKMHFVATLMVALGTIISAFWILAVNSWMHTPQGFVIKAGIFYPTNWWQIVFTPSFPYRLLHMLIAAFLTTALVVNGVASHYILHNKYVAHAKVMLRMGLALLVLLVPLQVIIGHQHGINTLHYQPRKIAAIEGLWETRQGADLTLLGWPDSKTATTRWAIKIPQGMSWVLTGKGSSTLLGLKNWPKELWPPVWPVFICFRIMVGVAVLLLITALMAVILQVKNNLFASWWLKWCRLISGGGFLAILAGWFTTEIGRQPYLVYGLLSTKSALSPITGWEVVLSSSILLLGYLIVFSTGVYIIFKLIARGPQLNNWTYGDHGQGRMLAKEVKC